MDVQIFRLSGIYGPGRSALDTVKRLGPDAFEVEPTFTTTAIKCVPPICASHPG